MPAAITAEDALKQMLLQIHEEAKGDKPVELKGNVLDTCDVTIGDVDKGFADGLCYRENLQNIQAKQWTIRELQ